MREAHNLAYQELLPDEILGCVEALGFSPDGYLLALNSYENRVYQIGIEDAQPLIGKFYRPGRWSDAAILEEHEFAIELAAADVPVVAPLTLANETLHHHGPFRFALYPRRGGHWPELGDESLLQQLGRLVGRTHTVGEAQPFDHRPLLDSDTFGYDSMETILGSDVLPAELLVPYETLAVTVLERIDQTFDQFGAVENIRLHGDLHPSNLLSRGETIHIVDLDDARMGPSVQDLWMFLSGSRDEQLRQLDVLLQGYSEFRRFSSRELQLIEPLRTLRIMHYAAWLTRRYVDPAFQQAFPWFSEPRYWETHILNLREQQALLDEAPLEWISL